MSVFDVLANRAQQLSLGPVGQILWPFSGTTVRIGVTGLSRAGKTAFLTSVAANFLARSSPRFALAPLGAGDVARFDEAGHLAALAADPPSWPARTNAVSLLALTTTLAGGLWPGRQLRLEFLDYPGEWLIDLPLLGLSFNSWSRAMLKRLEAPACSALAGPFLAFVHALPAKLGADEAVARAGARLYRDMLGKLRHAGMVFLQPGRHLMPAPGPEPPWMEFFPSVAENGLSDLLGRRYDAYVEAVRRDLASPLFADVDRLVILADVLSALHAGPAAFTDMSEALQAAAGSLRWEWSWLEAFAALRALRLPPRLISRVAFAATKADHVADRQRGNLAALMKALAGMPSTLVKTGYFAIASVRCTEDFVWTLEGRPVSAVRGRLLGQSAMTRSYPGEVPDRPPDADFWEHKFLALPEFEPMRLPDGGRNGIPNIGLDSLLDFITEDVL